MDAVLLTPACSDPLYRRAARVSMGTVFQVPWTYMGPQVFDKVSFSEDNRRAISVSHKSESRFWPQRGMENLRKLGFKTAALALSEHSISIEDTDLMKEEKLAVILGTEGDGLAYETLAECDYTVKIPMTHGVDSLNVAAASSVAFWQLGMLYLMLFEANNRQLYNHLPLLALGASNALSDIWNIVFKRNC